MALMRYYIDKRTLAGLASGGTATFAHGLPIAPDTVQIRFLNAGATATGNNVNMRAVIDATNVTIENAGAAASDNYEVVSIAFHSIIQ